MEKTFSLFQYMVIFGTLGVAIVASYLLYVQKKIKWAFILLFIAAFFIRLGIIFFDPYLSWWDERYHAVVAKNMMKNPLKPVFYPDENLPHDVYSWVGGRL